MRVATAIVASLLLAAPALADSSSATMNVSAQVIARAVVTVEGEPVVEVTEADVARGYVEIPAVRIRVHTNSLNGCLLLASKTDDAFGGVELAFGNTTMSVAHESWVARPYVRGGEIVTVSMRARLAPGAAAGRHLLPVQFSASPL